MKNTLFEHVNERAAIPKQNLMFVILIPGKARENYPINGMCFLIE